MTQFFFFHLETLLWEKNTNFISYVVHSLEICCKPLDVNLKYKLH